MSPSESDLRAALRDGEDDGGPDVDELIAHVRGRRAQRRIRVLSGAAIVVVVAAAGIGTAVVRSGSDGGGQPAAGPSSSVSPAPTPSAAAIGVSCPSSPPRFKDTLGAAPDAAMFAEPVVSVAICAYTETGSASSATAAPLTLTGDNATAVADSIETASKSKLNVVCPAIASVEKKQLAIIGVTASGTQLPTVTTDVSIPNCNQPITNGSAVRYAWKPPGSVAPLINALTTSTGKTLPSSGGGTVNGSPVR